LQQGGLRVDSREALLKGGKRGPSIVPGKPEASLLLAAILHQKGLKMPPGKQLSANTVTDLTAWVKAGAAWPAYSSGEKAPPAPGSGSSDLARQHWSFRPVTHPAVPAVKNKAWVMSPIDAFILAKLEARGLTPAPPADRRTLIRRVTFDLIGLPPTPEEVEAFVNDPSPSAWMKVIERLLASPAYGERWGRHWLDVARYSDSNGMDENVHYGNAWRYRDWVVNSINADKPIDQFFREQLAGDLLPSDNEDQRRQQLIATGFLVVGPKVISEVDTTKMLMDMVDEQVDTTGRTFMGMTFGCARCHDHKFDPISTEDYYALAGIFKSTKTMEVLQKPRMWHEYPIPTEADLKAKAEYDAKVAALKSAIATTVASATDELKKTLTAGAKLPEKPEVLFPADVKAHLKSKREELAALEKAPPAMSAAMGVIDGDVADLPVHIRGSFQQLGKVVPRRFPVILAGSSQSPLAPKRSGRLELAEWITRPDHPLTGRVFVNRVWRWHFGRGIVPSTDNFGRLGEQSTHPELLDWLAASFTAETQRTERGADEGLGWSLKSLHRLILRSNTYQMSSAWQPVTAAETLRSGSQKALSAPSASLRFKSPSETDHGNTLYWRFEPRRLEAEEIRDSLLAVSGRLDRTMGGTIITLKNREYFFDHTSKDGQSYDSTRRSLYLPIVRNHLYEVFQLFDYGDAQIPEGNRPTTTVAPQALFALNSDLIMDSAKALAAHLNGTPKERIQALYQRACGRPPSTPEVSQMESLLAKITAAAPKSSDLDRWTWMTHTVLASNEFVYLR
jgi:hypothetical protein